MMVWSLFIIDLMGLFFYTKISSIISIGDLPTTNIIEPFFSTQNRLHNIYRGFTHYKYYRALNTKSKSGNALFVWGFSGKGVRKMLMLI